jgi:outer membrane protein OmpU
MKKILLASSALVLMAGYAAAEVTVSGDGRMGVVYSENGVPGRYNYYDNQEDDNEFYFSSRIRIKFTATGETDDGLAFGGSVRADHYDADQALFGRAGEVFMSGGFGRLSMGDVDGGAEKVVGDLAEIGYTCLGCFNETIYLFGGNDPGARYDYSNGGLTLSLGLSDDEEYSLGLGYDGGVWSAGLGYENVPGGSRINFVDSDEVGITRFVISEGELEQIIAAVSGTFSNVTLKGIYGYVDGSSVDYTQYGVSASGTWGATTLEAYYRILDLSDLTLSDDDDPLTPDIDGSELEMYGIGAEYDLGGGATLAGAVASIDDTAVADLGVKFAF